MTDSECFFSRKYSCGVQCRMLYTLIFISELHQKLAPTKHQKGCIRPLIVWAGWQLLAESVSRVAILPSEKLSRVAILPCESVSRVAILPSENVSKVAILSFESVSRVAIYFSSISCFRACGSVSSHPPPLAQHNPERGDSFASKFRPSGIWTLGNTTKYPFLCLPSYLKEKHHKNSEYFSVLQDVKRVINRMLLTGHFSCGLSV